MQPALSGVIRTLGKTITRPFRRVPDPAAPANSPRTVAGKKDRAEGIGMVVVMMAMFPLTFAPSATSLDVGFWLMNHMALTSVAQDRADSIALVGGTGTRTKQTIIERQYEALNVSRCTKLLTTETPPPGSSTRDVNVTQSPLQNHRGWATVNAQLVANIQTMNPHECVAVEQAYTQWLPFAALSDVKCGPELTGDNKQRGWCDISWHYYSFPGSVMGLFSGDWSSNRQSTGLNPSGGLTGIDPNLGTGVPATLHAYADAESETGLDNPARDLVNRIP